MDLALNNLQRLICHKTQPTNQPIHTYTLELILTFPSVITLIGLQLRSPISNEKQYTVGSAYFLLPIYNVCHRSDIVASDLAGKSPLKFHITICGFPMLTDFSSLLLIGAPHKWTWAPNKPYAFRNALT